MTKAIAFYLPQFHEIPENNEWWGEGFTEWTNLKKARPLFDGHHQPNEPLNDNYYNLLDKETVIWQTDLAKKYSIYAFNYYHYWFKGKAILEKPAENLLKWKDIDQKFMFIWANHDWTRSWVGGNEVLLKMDYGEESDWLAHINYLMKFFIDKRYIKISNKPVFQIYIPLDICNYDKMIAVWDRECKNNGFDGIYIIENHHYDKIRKNEYSKACSAISMQEPKSGQQYTTYKSNFRRVFFEMKEILMRIAIKIARLDGKLYKIAKKKAQELKKIDITSYDETVKNSIEALKSLNLDKKIYYEVYTGWDNTPRYGKRGSVIDGSNPQKFKEYLLEVKEISEIRKQEYIFILCWNEWCEGMCLEPTKKYGYGYLEAVREVFGKD